MTHHWASEQSIGIVRHVFVHVRAKGVHRFFYAARARGAGLSPCRGSLRLAHTVDDPDAGYTMSLWENEAAMRSYENGEILQTTILPRLKPFSSGDYTTTRCEVRFAEEFDQ
jgi:hypothetical protein